MKLNYTAFRRNRVFKYTAEEVIAKTKEFFGIVLTSDEVRKYCDTKNQTLDPVMFKDKKSALNYMDTVHKQYGLKITDAPKYDGRNYGDGHVEPSIQLFERDSDGSWMIPHRLINYFFGDGDFAVVVTVESYSDFEPAKYPKPLESLVLKKMIQSV